RTDRGEVVDLAVDALAVRAEQRHEAAELEPAQVELAPLFQVFRVRLLVARLQRVAADVGGPVRDARQREVDAGGDLVAQIAPARHHVAAPACGRIALLAGEHRTGEDEYALVGIAFAAALVYRAGGHQRIRVEERRAGAQRG